MRNPTPILVALSLIGCLPEKTGSSSEQPNPFSDILDYEDMDTGDDVSGEPDTDTSDDWIKANADCMPDFTVNVVASEKLEPVRQCLPNKPGFMPYDEQIDAEMTTSGLAWKYLVVEPGDRGTILMHRATMFVFFAQDDGGDPSWSDELRSDSSRWEAYTYAWVDLHVQIVAQGDNWVELRISPLTDESDVILSTAEYDSYDLFQLVVNVEGIPMQPGDSAQAFIDGPQTWSSPEAGIPTLTSIDDLSPISGVTFTFADDGS